MLGMRWLLLLVAAVAFVGTANGFSVVAPQQQRHARVVLSTSPLRMSKSDNDDDNQKITHGRRPWRRLQKWIAPATLGVLTTVTPILSFTRPALASAPVMVPVQQQRMDPESEAMFDNNKKIEKKNAEEMQAFQKKAREIASTQGEAARRAYEKQWEAERQEKAQEKARGLEQLKRSLLDQGLDPFTDPEANRQIILYEKGIDLAEVPGTKYYMEKDFEKNQPKRSMKVQKAPQRFIVKCMVADLKKRGKDPLEYFEQNQEKTADLFQMSNQKAMLLAQQYKEKQAAEDPVLDESESELKQRLKEEEKAKKAADKAAKKEAKQKAKEEARLRKEEAKRQKEEAKQQQQVEKAAAAAAAGAATAGAAAATAKAGADVVGAGVEAVTGSDGTSVVTKEIVQETTPKKLSFRERRAAAKAESRRQKEETEQRKQAEKVAAAEATALTEEFVEEEEEGAPVEETEFAAPTEKKGTLPVGKAVGTIVAIGGGGYAFKVLQEKKERDEEERQRQFKLIMGVDEDEEVDGAKGMIDVDEIPPPPEVREQEKAEDMELDDNDFIIEGDDTVASATEAPKKRRGFKAMFGRKNANDRETDLTVLVSEDATAPEFALLLSKLLTYGAPGRFPNVVSLRGKMPMTEFDLEESKQMLEEAAEEAGISSEEGAEIFANVVNCMLIDIVDLASSTLKEDDKVTVDAIDIVVTFMNHAASLYDSVAEGVVITPVTYGGTLGKNKLEQMYSTYAVSGMMSMNEDFSARVGLLQDVFCISEKKAEGLMMKAMQKNMMKMLKDGEGMEGMDEMMKAMGGAEGMEGLGALAGMDGEEGPSPEQLKEMLLTLKTMKDSGTIPPEELEDVRSQFKEAFGSSIEEVMSDADKDQESMSESDKELLELMKSILDD